MKPVVSYTRPLTQEQASLLREILARDGFAFSEREHTAFFASKDKVNVAVYPKGPKVLVQGRGTEEFVKFTLEPQVLGAAELGYEEVLKPDMFKPHFGIDESGKGDFFGPLVVAGVYVDAEIARALLDAGVMDSKRIASDQRVRQLAGIIRGTPGLHCYVLGLGPEKYNELYAKFRSLNFLLAWAHAEVIAVLRRYVPECSRALSDQFAHQTVLERAVAKRGIEIEIEQRTRGEADVAVAAASILARERFIDWMDECSRRLGYVLPRGASSLVKQAATRLLDDRGQDALPKAAKMHFKTAGEL
ncbi:MAG: ribonuclease HIII [Verrucomicrobiales bacterium]